MYLAYSRPYNIYGPIKRRCDKYGYETIVNDIRYNCILLIIVNRQNWLKTYSQVINFAILPAIGFLITSVISSSIALSLGMVGALSIIRFRTPVKNPIELVSYFLLLTVGIVSNVNPNLTLNFAFFMTFVLLLLSIYEKFVSKSKIFNLFEEGDIFILSIESNSAWKFPSPNPQ